MNDPFEGEENDTPIDFYVDKLGVMPPEIVQSYYDPYELEYIEECINQTMQAYEAFGWEHQPTPQQLREFMHAAVYYLRTNKESDFVSTWRTQVQLLDFESEEFEILLIIGEWEE